MFAASKKANKSKPHIQPVTWTFWTDKLWKSQRDANAACMLHVVTGGLWAMSVNLTDEGQVQITLIGKNKMHWSSWMTHGIRLIMTDEDMYTQLWLEGVFINSSLRGPAATRQIKLIYGRFP